MSRFFVISGRSEPTVLVDEAGEPASFDTQEQARQSAESTPMCQALGYAIIEMNEGVVGCGL